MTWEQIRPLVLGIARREGDIFVEKLYDSTADERFYRPVGGAVEFGEMSTETLQREYREELDISVDVNRYLGTIENVFTFQGNRGHEIALVYEISLPGGFPAALPVTGEDDDGTRFTADWEPVSMFTEGTALLYPEGLVTLLTSDTTHVRSPD